MVALKLGMFGRGPDVYTTPPIAPVAALPMGANGGQITALPPKPGFNDIGGTADKLRRLAGHLQMIGGIDNSGQLLVDEVDKRQQGAYETQARQQQYQQHRQDEQSDWMAREQYKIAHPGKTDLEERIGVLNSYKAGLGSTYAENYAANGGGGMQVVTTPQGTFMVPKAPAATAPSGPSPGTVEGGYRFKGGNAGDPTAWEPVGGAASQGAGTFRR